MITIAICDDKLTELNKTKDMCSEFTSQYSDHLISLEDIQFIDDFPVSAKKGGGIGTKSMAYTVRRFHGTIYFKAKDSVFTTRLMLNI